MFQWKILLTYQIEMIFCLPEFLIFRMWCDYFFFFSVHFSVIRFSNKISCVNIHRNAVCDVIGVKELKKNIFILFKHEINKLATIGLQGCIFLPDSLLYSFYRIIVEICNLWKQIWIFFKLFFMWFFFRLSQKDLTKSSSHWHTYINKYMKVKPNSP